MRRSLFESSRRGLVLAVLALVSGVAGSTPPAQAEDRAPSAKPASLTLSGGVSLGAYEAGYAYLWTRAARRGQKLRDLRLVTGTSAGAINSLITAMSSCRPDNKDPTEDLGWKTWLHMRFDRLYEPGHVTSTSVLTRKGMQSAVDEVEKIWNEGLPEDCDIVMGISVTRTKAEMVEVNAKLEVPRQLEQFVVRIRGRGPDTPPAVENYLPKEPGTPQVLLPLCGDGKASDFDYLRALLFASSAFPIAFPAETLPHCIVKSDASDKTCRAPHESDFVDGGVFDNHPLRLAVGVADYGVVKGPAGRVRWKEAPEPDPEKPKSKSGIEFHYLDPGITSYVSESPEGSSNTLNNVVKSLSSSRKQRPGALQETGNLVGQLVETARMNELYTLAEEEPELLNKGVEVARRNYPTMSGELGAFLGFFETKFRTFDFYLGMYDAFVGAIKELDSSNEPDARDALLAEMHPTLDASGDGGAAEASWKPFYCMLRWYDGDERFESACEGSDMRDFRILLQVSLDRLYSVCRAEPDHARKSDNPHCRAAADRDPPRVIGEKAWPFERRNDDESEFHYMMRLLTRYQLHFEDLGLREDQAKHASLQIQRRLATALTALSNEQPGRLQRAAILTAGRVAMNTTVAYEPPKHWGYAIFGTGAELGGSIQPFRTKAANPLRLNLALQVLSLRTLIRPSNATVAFYFVGGPELQLLWWKQSAVLQPILGIRAGYQFGLADRWTSRECTPENARGDGRNCSQPVLQPYLAIALAERLRMQATFTWFPQRQAFGSRRVDGLVAVGYQFF